MESADFFFKHLEQYGNAVALIDEKGENVSYQELAVRADRWAEQIPHRCLVFLVCKNTIASVVGYVSCMRNGIVPVLIYPEMDKRLLENLLEHYRPSYIWMPFDDMTSLGERIYQEDGYCLEKISFNEETLLGEDLTLLLTTSGSTGSPKLVRQTWKNIQSNTRSIIDYLHIDSSDRAITTLPMHYTYGLSILNTHLCAGASVILTEATLLEKKFWNLLESQKATTFGGVPYTYEILKKLRFEKMEVPSLRYLTQAGGKLSKELAKEFYQICEEKGLQLIIMYGQTEATARMSYLPWENAKEKVGSIGKAIPGGRFSLIDETGKEIQKADEIGELVYWGENVTPGYAKSYEDLVNPDENQGKLYTGDMAKRDEQGFYYIVGRKKRFLKLFGNRVNLDEVEQLLKKEGIENVCAGKDDALIIFLTDMKMKEQTEKFLTYHTGIQRASFVIKQIPTIPRSESGKILYSVLETE